MRISIWIAIVAICAIAGWTAHRWIGTAAAAAPAAEDDPAFRTRDGVIEVADAAAAILGLETLEVRPCDEPVQLRITGRTSLDLEHVTHVKAPFAGKVVEIGPRLGTKVSGPDVAGAGATSLCVIESVDLANAKSAWSKAKVQLALDEDALRRTRELVATKVLAEKFQLDAETAVTKDRADLKAARQNLLVFGIDDEEIARIDQEEGRERMVYAIRSPCGGTIAEKNVTRGELADPTVNLFTIADTATLWVWGDVYERDWKRVRIGQRMRVELAAFPDDPVDCTIDFVSPLLDPATRSIRVRGVLDNRDGRLLADMSATLLVTVDDGRDALVAPTESVVHEGQADYVLVRAGRGEAGSATRFRRQAVKVEPLGAERVRIVEGLAPGAVIVKRDALGLFQEMHE